MNIGDEYVNKDKKFGYWQDAGVKTEGEGVFLITKAFLETFSLKKKVDCKKYLKRADKTGNNLITPFFTGGKDSFLPEVFLSLLYGAEKSAVFTTPYLALSKEILNAFLFAVKSGVKVKVIIPAVPDKKRVYGISLYYADILMKNGVEVYKFTPGFTHGKTVIIDDEIMCIGSANLDFRSLYMQFESSAVVYGDCVKKAGESIKNILRQSEKLTLKRKKGGGIRKIKDFFIKFFVYYI